MMRASFRVKKMGIKKAFWMASRKAKWNGFREGHEEGHLLGPLKKERHKARAEAKIQLENALKALLANVSQRNLTSLPFGRKVGPPLENILYQKSMTENHRKKCMVFQNGFQDGIKVIKRSSFS